MSSFFRTISLSIIPQKPCLITVVICVNIGCLRSQCVMGLLRVSCRLWGEPFGKVYFAGSESSPVFRGYMDGGVRAAAVATKRVSSL